MTHPRVVKVYSAPSCPDWAALKDFMKDHGIAYQEFNVALDLSALREWIERSGQMDIPGIIIDDQVLVGFDPSLIRQKLSL